MRLKLTLVLLVMVLLPIGLLLWLGVRVKRYERQETEQRFLRLLSERLSDMDTRIVRLMGERERQCIELTRFPSMEPAAIRQRLRDASFVSQFFVLDPDGRLVFPPAAGRGTASEQEFLQRTRDIWRGNDLAHPNGDGIGAQFGNALFTQNMQESSAPSEETASESHGWYTWYWGKGINLIFWQRGEGGLIQGAELNRARLVADVIAALPDTVSSPTQTLAEGSITLADSSGASLYRWGSYDPPPDEKPRVTCPVSPPLGAWRLAYYAPVQTLMLDTRLGSFVGFGAGLLGAVIGLIVLAAYFYRESAREMREAGQRVSFVNQVSHELKTPLTNIRMYAEMIEEALPDDDADGRRRIGVIVGESRRLGRLIANILAFSRQQRGKLTLRAHEGVVDDCVRQVVEQFAPSLAAKEIQCTFAGAATRRVSFDCDAVGQILGNLLSNVEKYAAEGKCATISSRLDDDCAVIEVADKGPGIPEKHRDRVFRPFERLSDKLNEGVSGTGIGLTIARDLARLHGGDLRLLHAAGPGARFEIRIRVGGIEP